MRCRGFTLVELMVTIAIVAILLAIGLPSFQGSLRSNRVATATNDLIASIALARSEAIRSPGGAGICASDDGETCEGTSWNDGWMIWIERTGDDEPGGDDERVLRHVQGNRKLDIAVEAPGGGEEGSKVLFDFQGRLTGTTRTFTVMPDTCPEGQELVRELSLSLTGQVTTQRRPCP